jgi:serine/threonine protein phosphatase PrpC
VDDFDPAVPAAYAGRVGEPDTGAAPGVVDIRHGHLDLTVAGGGCVGNRYPANFDVLHIAPDRLVVVVADGMGDGEGSTVAGRTAVDTFVARGRSTPVGPAALRATLARAQQRVRAAGERLGVLTGCTLTALVGGDPDAPDPHAWLVHIGDSRAYRLRGGVLELLTTDHTVAWLGAVHGWYPADSPQAAAARYHLLRYVGHPAAPEPDVHHVSLRPGDVYCLCTDGIAEQVPYQRLAQRLGADLPADRIVDALLADSLAAGGRDNATVALVRVRPA